MPWKTDHSNIHERSSQKRTYMTLLARKLFSLLSAENGTTFQKAQKRNNWNSRFAL
ncbi:unnamed protein product, partial [Nesidiocoris tenuis]